MTILFISDLHLDPLRPAVIEAFLAFLEQDAAKADSLYVLGDLFEAWVGDDDDTPEFRGIASHLRDLTGSGVTTYVMHGNRDFLIGEQFAEQTGCKLLGDFEKVDVYGEPALITHGDLLCTDDKPYLELRSTLRQASWKSDFLSKTLQERRAIAESLRELSQKETQAKPSEIMDVNGRTVEQTMRDQGVRLLIHGHTHRPGIHHFDLDGAQATRIVLGDWYEHGSVLRWDESGFELSRVDLPI